MEEGAATSIVWFVGARQALGITPDQEQNDVAVHEEEPTEDPLGEDLLVDPVGEHFLDDPFLPGPGGQGPEWDPLAIPTHPINLMDEVDEDAIPCILARFEPDEWKDGEYDMYELEDTNVHTLVDMCVKLLARHYADVDWAALSPPLPVDVMQRIQSIHKNVRLAEEIMNKDAAALLHDETYDPTLDDQDEDAYWDY